MFYSFRRRYNTGWWNFSVKPILLNCKIAQCGFHSLKPPIIGLALRFIGQLLAALCVIDECL